jgi:hypothetical protein
LKSATKTHTKTHRWANSSSRSFKISTYVLSEELSFRLEKYCLSVFTITHTVARIVDTHYIPHTYEYFIYVCARAGEYERAHARTDTHTQGYKLDVTLSVVLLTVQR